jgi:uncharacterized integral membrane protein
MKVILVIIVGIVFVLGVLFAAFNSGNPPPTASVNFFGKTYEIAVSLFGFICFGIGIASVVLFALVDEISLRTRIRRLKRETQTLRKEINALRNLPLASEILTRETEDLDTRE